MSDDIVSLRIVVVSPAAALRDLVRQGAGLAPIPIEVAEADSAARASRLLGAGDTDLVFIDVALGGDERAAVIQTARAVPQAAAKSPRKPPITIVIAPASFKFGGPGEAGEPDGVVAQPSTLEDARAMVAGFVRLHAPSRVLVVDDSSTMRSIIRKILCASRFPMEVTEAEEGVAALRQIASGRFDFVLLDYNMPGLNGVETLLEIKRQYPKIEVVMVTSTPDEDVAKKARACGAAAFLKKPFYPTDIDTLMLRICGTRATAGMGD
jgi:CheY-like chemotaxis protein